MVGYFAFIPLTKRVKYKNILPKNQLEAMVTNYSIFITRKRASNVVLFTKTILLLSIY